jgi:hypothetical protein
MQSLHQNPSYREKVNDLNNQMTSPEDEHDRGHNGTGMPGVGENRKLNRTGPATLIEFDQIASLVKGK